MTENPRVVAARRRRQIAQLLPRRELTPAELRDLLSQATAAGQTRLERALTAHFLGDDAGVDGREIVERRSLLRRRNGDDAIADDPIEAAQTVLDDLTRQARDLAGEIAELERDAAAALTDVDAGGLVEAGIAKARASAEVEGRRSAAAELQRRIAATQAEIARLEAEERERQADVMREALRAHADEVMASAHELLGELEALESEAKALDAFRRVGPFGSEPRAWRNLHQGLEMALGAVHFRESMARNAEAAVAAEQERQARRAAERQKRDAVAGTPGGRQKVAANNSFEL